MDRLGNKQGKGSMRGIGGSGGMTSLSFHCLYLEHPLWRGKLSLPISLESLESIIREFFVDKRKPQYSC